MSEQIGVRTNIRFKDFALEIKLSAELVITEVVLYDQYYHDPIAVFTPDEFDAQLKKLAIEFGPK